MVIEKNMSSVPHVDKNLKNETNVNEMYQTIKETIAINKEIIEKNREILRKFKNRPVN
jgi:hypothetical protein